LAPGKIGCRHGNPFVVAQFLTIAGANSPSHQRFPCWWVQPEFSVEFGFCFPYRSRLCCFRWAAHRFSKSCIWSEGAIPNRLSDRIMARTLT
jgi:hypothetical protein